VAGESLRRDRRLKAAVYARAGVPEYWILNLDARTVEVFADPDAATGSYRRTRTCSTAETVSSEALPRLAFAVSEIFA
jgi:Uma2 family endonuclease